MTARSDSRSLRLLRSLRSPVRALTVCLALVACADALGRTADRAVPGPKPVPTASLTLDCGGGKKITISTGSSTGNCITRKEGGGQCFAEGQEVAAATCSGGCGTAGPGTCSTTQ